MILAPDDAALFYRAWGPLLVWVNEQRKVVLPFPPPTPGHPVEPSLGNAVRKVLWADDVLRERFLAEAASDLGREEQDLVASWRHRVTGRFIVERHLKKHSIFMASAVYAVVGIYTPIAAMVPDVPTFIGATLIPFGSRSSVTGHVS